MRKRAFTTFSVVAICASILGGVLYSSNRCDWTGFGRCTTIQPIGVLVRPSKTLWDWFALLGVPVAVAATGTLLARAEKLREEKRAERRKQDDRELAQDQQNENALQAYFDRVTDLLTAGKLRHVQGDPKPDSDDENKVRVNLAVRSRTLATLRRLDGARKGQLLQFLSELRMMDPDRPVLYMRGADLRGAQLSGQSLWNNRLWNADLRCADLSSSHLDEADLVEADLRDANLTGASLNCTVLMKANLSGLTIKQLKFAGCMAEQVKFCDAILEDVDFLEWVCGETNRRCDLLLADFSGATMKNVRFTGAYLHEAKFVGARLIKVTFTNCDLTDVDFSPADLTEVEMLHCWGLGNGEQQL